MQKSIDTLVLEITRRCNMACAHCMRGESQNKDMAREIIDLTLKDTNSIGSVVFTGGEPTLNIDAIEYTLDICKNKHIHVGGFYIVTNGKIVTERFLIACLRWHAYTIQCGEETEFSGVALSKDKFHEPIPAENVALLQTLACFRPEDKHNDFDRYGVLPMGRAKNLKDIPVKTHFKFPPDRQRYFITDRSETECYIETMTVTVNGDILSDCDYEYDDIEQILVGTIYNPTWLEDHIEKYH